MSLRRAIEVVAAGGWPAADAVATVTLDFDDRYRRRVRLVDDTGEAFLLDLDDATRLALGAELDRLAEEQLDKALRQGKKLGWL